MPITDKQLPDLVRMIAGTAEAIGGQLTPTAAAVIAGDLRSYDMQDISQALAEVRRTARGRFSLSDVLRIIDARDGRPHSDEAWSIALAGFDESATVVLTDEIRLAMGIARPVVDVGDMIGGRRTFLAAYDRLVSEARAAARPCAWSVSLGADPHGREHAVSGAVRLGRLTSEQADRTLAQLGHRAPASDDGRAIAGLITGSATSVKVSASVREKLAELRAALVSKSAESNSQRKERERAEYAELCERSDRILGIGEFAPKEGDKGQG